ncbi:myosin-2-like isoform X2 [Salvia splendens]|uniref:myosin-2-like isoform X2 n=1 Tax=Salvia splendens TaxID=180675 RepID=UPI001C259B89|nr:myosin-2-like isoform X2 [Salvia splendens]
MLAVAPSCITRSSLEEMLEALQRRDEIEAQTPPDLPPALPRRAVPRTRLPSFKRRLPVAVSFKADETAGRYEIRGEIAGIEETASDKVGSRKGLDDGKHLHEIAVTLQSYVRGWLARKQFSRLRSIVETGIAISQVQALPLDMLALIVGKLQERVLMAKETLQIKEKESVALREQLAEYEERINQWEEKIKSAEDMWEKRIASLQDLAKSEIQKMKEQVKRKVSFEDEKHDIVGAPSEKLVKLKRMMKAWMKGNKVRLIGSKTKIHSVGHGEADAHPRKWWGNKTNRSNNNHNPTAAV